MPYDADSFKAGFAVGRMLWRPPIININPGFDHIAVTVLPLKTEYLDGETLDFTGIEVTIFRPDGTVYTDSNYPDGVIPFAELTFPVTVAPNGGTTENEIDGYAFSVDVGAGNYDKRTEILFVASDNPSVDPPGTVHTAGKLEMERTGNGWNLYYDGDRIYFGPQGPYQAVYVCWVRNRPENTANVGYYYNVLRDGLPDDYTFATPIPLSGGGTAVIPVHWTPPASKFPAVLSVQKTSFKITVTAGGNA